MAKCLNKVIDVEDYLEILGYERESLTLGQLEDKVGVNYWNYPLSDINEVVENDLIVVIVRMPDESGTGGYDYRFCELPE